MLPTNSIKLFPVMLLLNKKYTKLESSLTRMNCNSKFSNCASRFSVHFLKSIKSCYTFLRFKLGSFYYLASENITIQCIYS